MEIVRSRARLKVRFFSRQSDDSSSEQPRLEEAGAPSPILENPSHREEPAKDREFEGNAYTRSGRQVKPV